MYLVTTHMRTQCFPEFIVFLLQASFVTSIAAGAAHSLVSTDAGNAYAWGCGEHGRLGNGTTANRHQPTKVCFHHSCLQKRDKLML